MKIKSLSEFINESREMINESTNEYEVSDFTKGQNLIVKQKKKGRHETDILIDNGAEIQMDPRFDYHLTCCPEEWQELEWLTPSGNERKGYDGDYEMVRKLYKFTSTKGLDGASLILNVTSGEVRDEVTNVKFESDFNLTIKGLYFVDCEFEGPIQVQGKRFANCKFNKGAIKL